MLTEFAGGSDLIRADLVYDGGTDVLIPSQMGVPREDQMDGSPAEQLSELAGRVCYDSLGKGRPSFTQDVVTGADPNTGEQLLAEVEGYHDHIAKVGHGSVWEHFNFTVELHYDFAMIAAEAINRPGMFLQKSGNKVRITANLRTITDWFNFGDESLVRRALATMGSRLAPHIVGPPSVTYTVDIVEPIDDEERWVSLFISGSRGLSHELVRHKFRTAVSQRSTRFVDESESAWVEHPLVSEYRRKTETKDEFGVLYNGGNSVAFDACVQYELCVDVLEPWLISRGVDKTSARKQARGAARGYLGNALYTELIFSASVAQWKRILRQRASVFADAEIREMACKALLTLKHSRYADCFANWWLDKSPDGIGLIAREEK